METLYVWINQFELTAGHAFDQAEREGDNEFISLMIAVQWFVEECEPVPVETFTGDPFQKKLLLKIDV